MRTVTCVLVLYDDDCGLCTHAVSWCARRCGDLDFRPLEEPSASIVVMTEGGERLEGIDAVAAVLSNLTVPWRHLGRALPLPVLHGVGNALYRVVARHRSTLSAWAGWTSCRRPAALQESSAVKELVIEELVIEDL